MLISKEELRFDFQGARFDLSTGAESGRNRELLGWIFSQFLYGEVTGIQCGHWLYHAPHLSAATFLAKQAGEELSHVRKFLRIFSLLGIDPKPPHWVVKLMSTGMMGKSWGEHVALEMALGEGLVLGTFYAMVDTIDHPEIHKLLDSSCEEEQRHVEFGERETALWLERHPGTRKLILAQALIQAWAMRKMKGFIIRRLGVQGHPVLGQFDRFFEHTLRSFETRIERLGLSPVPLTQIAWHTRLWLITTIPWRRLFNRFFLRSPLLTSTYLTDPSVKAEIHRYRS